MAGDGRVGEADPGSLQRPLDPLQRLALDHELLAGLGGELGAHQEPVIGELVDALGLQGLDQARAEVGILDQLLADAFEQLFHRATSVS